MVTGVYDPETSGASLQCRQLVATLRASVDFQVLTTSANPRLPRRATVDGVAVTRVYVDPSRPPTKILAFAALTRAFARLAGSFDIVHFHGLSQKTMVLAVLARLWRKRTVIKLTSFGHDDAITMQRRGGAAFWSYRTMDRVIAVSPRLEDAWRAADLDPSRIALIPNAVDSERFRPASAAERAALKRSLGWAAAQPAVLFVGFFSHEKRPDVLYRAWSALWDSGLPSTLVFIGKTRSAYYEVDASIAEAVRADAGRTGRAEHIVWVEHATDIERYYRASDVFALPTLREGLPNVLLEAMACAVPPVITRLDGVTDWIVEDQVTGRLVSPDDDRQLLDALRDLLENEPMRAAIGRAARAAVEQHFTPEQTAAKTLAVYRDLMSTVAA
jgi:glycosyltransferase involved in cell wall biosynthesis